MTWLLVMVWCVAVPGGETCVATMPTLYFPSREACRAVEPLAIDAMVARSVAPVTWIDVECRPMRRASA